MGSPRILPSLQREGYGRSMISSRRSPTSSMARYHAEVVATDPDEMVRQGHHLSTIADNVVVKVPMTPGWRRAPAPGSSPKRFRSTSRSRLLDGAGDHRRHHRRNLCVAVSSVGSTMSATTASASWPSCRHIHGAGLRDRSACRPVCATPFTWSVGPDRGGCGNDAVRRHGPYSITRSPTSATSDSTGTGGLSGGALRAQRPDGTKGTR